MRSNQKAFDSIWTIGRTAGLFGLMMMVLAVVIPGGCGDRSKSQGPDVGLLIPADYAHHEQIIRRAAKDAADEYGRVRIDVRVAKAGQEAAVFDELLEHNAMALCVGLIGGVDLDHRIYNSVLSGLPVVLWNADRPDSRRDSFVGGDQQQAGRQLVQLLAEVACQGQATVLILKDKPGDAANDAALLSCRSELQKHPGITVGAILDCKGDAQVAAKVLAKILDNESRITAIASTGPWICQPVVLDAVKPFNVKIVAIGNDQACFDALKAGRCQALVVHDIYSWVNRAVSMCLLRLRGQIIRQGTSIVPVVVRHDQADRFAKRWGTEPVTTRPAEIKSDQI